jgi:hypothetical protein
MSLVYIRAALETALNAMAGIIPSVVITSSTNGSFITATPHLLVSGIIITISGHSVSVLNDSFYVVVTGPNSFTLLHKVTRQPITSAASGTDGVVAANLTAWDNVSFQPIAGVPYQKVSLVLASPQNPSFGGGQRRETGFMQVSLCYPSQKGTTAITTRVELIRSTFPRGASFTSNGITVHIPKDANVLQGMTIDENYVIVVRIPYWADIFY